MNEATPPDVALYRAVDEVLHYLWDPIGIAGIPQARDEDPGYLPHVWALLERGSAEQEIAEYLGAITTGRIGLPARPEHELEVARYLLSCRSETEEPCDGHGRPFLTCSTGRAFQRSASVCFGVERTFDIAPQRSAVQRLLTINFTT